MDGYFIETGSGAFEFIDEHEVLTENRSDDYREIESDEILDALERSKPKNFYEMILDVYRQKIEAEKNKFEYINPNAMSDILNTVEVYGKQKVSDKIWDWVQNMYEV